LLTRALDGLGEDVADACRMLAQDVGLDPQGDGRVGMPEPGGDHVETGTPARSRGGVQVTKIM
jgi:hypothetical protein